MDIFTINYKRLIDVLKEHGYEKIKILPLVEKQIPGLSEIRFWFNYHFTKKSSYFTPIFFTDYYYRCFKAQVPNTFILFKLFAQNKSVAPEELNMVLRSEDIDLFVREGFLDEYNGYFRSRIRILPFFDYFVVTDPFDRTIKDFTYFGIDSLHLANNVRSTLAGQKFQRAIDIGTGTGVQALNIAYLCEEVLGVDINQRAIRFAQTNARINNITNTNFFLSNLFEKVTGKFDLLLANPPFVFYPETHYDALTYRDGYGGKLGLEITSAILNQLENILTDDGVAKILCTSPMIRGKDMLVEEIRRIFSNKKYKICLKPIRYFMHPNYFTFHRKNHIAYNILYIFTLKRSNRFLLHIERRNFFAGFSDFVEISLLYGYFLYRRILGFVSHLWERD